MKIGIYGGTFNPPHLGHLAAARTALDALKLDKLILMPAAVPPHKVLPENSPAQEHRLAMVERMADAMERPGAVEVSTLELEREGKSYTSDTLEAIHRQYPEAELWLLMGTDMFLTLQAWHDPQRILSLAGIAAGADGLIIEVHPEPKVAMSDAAQQLTIPEYQALVKKVGAVAAAVGRELPC